MSDLAATTRVDALDVFVRLLSELDAGPTQEPGQFYDRLCEAVCNLTSMRRAGLMLYDDTRELVVPVGSHGLPRELLRQIYGNLEETPIARRALGEDRVVEASEALEHELPTRYAGFAGVTTLTCTPVAAGGRWLGVIFADRGGGRFTLTKPERHAMWTLGKTAALAASARIATTEEERARVLTERIALARHIHERVIQRLFGVSLVVGSGRELSAEERQRCAAEIQAALADLRATLSQPLAPALPATGTATLREELDRLGRHYGALELDVTWELDEPLPAELEPLAQSVLAEALRNADRHATPASVRVRVGRVDGAFTLEVRNDGLRAQNGDDPARAVGMGLRLAAFDALQRGGVVEFGPEGPEWRVRLVLPLP
jgi:signal transduction histidine kinase